MESSIFAYIRRHTWRQQLVILGLTLLSFPPLYYSLELPKIIINSALGEAGAQPHAILGRELDQVTYLFALCGVFLALVLVSGALKYALNVYAGIVAERTLRRLRYQLYGHVLRFPLPHLRRVSQGELVQMINAETEALGGFVGDALAVPAFQGGTLLVILFFIFMQDWVLGLAAIALYPLQMWLIPKLQRRVNELGKRRVRQVRRNAERISETVAGVRDVRANDASAYELARFSAQLGQVFWIRFDIYKKKFLIKFINNFIAQLGPFFFFTIGGYLVIKGQVTLGALVAVVAAHKDLASPWRELLTYYQTMFDVKIKYEQTVSQFMPAGLREADRMAADPPEGVELGGPLRVQNLTLADEAGDLVLEGLSFEVDRPARLAIVGRTTGKEELTLALAGLLRPTGGRIRYGEADVAALPDSVVGRRIGYVGAGGYVFGGSLEDNLLYGLKHRPAEGSRGAPSGPQGRDRERQEALLSGNSPFDPDADWLDWEAAGATKEEDRLPLIVRALRLSLLDGEVYAMGLRGAVDVLRHGDLPDRLLEARRAMQDRLEADPRLARLVERFEPERYNTNATLAENLLFGAPADTRLSLSNPAADAYVRETLDATGLAAELVEAGYRVAQTMVELFADLPPDHEYFRQFSFIAPEELPDYRALLARADPARLDALAAADRERLLALPFRLVPARHRLGLVTPELTEKVLVARQRFRERLPRRLEGAIAFFDPEAYNAPSTIQDNIIFGKIAYGQAGAAARIVELTGEILEGLDLRGRVTQVGLSYQCGVGGGRLSAAQRQKLTIARALLRRPEILVMHDPVNALDPQEQVRLRDGLLEEFAERTLLWAVHHEDWSARFDQVLRLDLGRVEAAGAGGDDGGEGDEGAGEDGADDAGEPAPPRELAAAS